MWEEIIKWYCFFIQTSIVRKENVIKIFKSLSNGNWYEIFFEKV